MSDIQPGDIVFCRFPIENGASLPHYVLVISVLDNGDIRAAYGTSKKTHTALVEGEFLVDAPDDLDKAGLHVPTRFVLTRIAQIKARDVIGVTGRIMLETKAVARRLGKALSEAELI